MRKWMLCYVLLGIIQNGMLPIILPLGSHPGPTAGLTYAAYSLCGIAAPFIGAASDRHRRHRLTLAAGLVVAGIGLLAEDLGGGVLRHVLISAMIGLGVSSASTVGTMFVVEVEPERSWDAGIGMLQAATSAGQLAGLLIAGALGLHWIHVSFLLAGACMLVAVPLALAFAPDPLVRIPRPELRPRPSRSGDLTNAGPQRSLHRVTADAIAALAHNRLAAFLAIWLLSYAATNALSVMFAVAMVRNFHASATLPTGAYAAGVGLSLLLYRPVAAWDRRYGPWHVLVCGLAGRLVVIAAMAAVAAFAHSDALVVLLVAFAATQIIWPLLSVASTALAIRLSPARQAESVGLLNAVSSIGATLGGIVGGSLLDAGFTAFCVVVVLCLAAALLLARVQIPADAVPAAA